MNGIERTLRAIVVAGTSATLLLALSVPVLTAAGASRTVLSALVLVAAGGLVFTLVTVPLAVATHGQRGAGPAGRARIWCGFALNTAGSVALLPVSQGLLEVGLGVAILVIGGAAGIAYLILLRRLERALGY